MKLAITSRLLLIVGCLQMACSEPDTFQSLIKTSEEVSGINCVAGGVKIQTGIDRNENGTLDQGEIDNETFVCNGMANTDRLTMLSFGGSYGSESTDWFYPSGYGTSLQSFNIDNYNNVDSVIFTAALGTTPDGNVGYLELYNVTDAVPIEGSLLTSDHVLKNPIYYVFKRSGNIASALPHKAVTLDVRMKSEQSPGFVGTAPVYYLLIYKH